MCQKLIIRNDVSIAIDIELKIMWNVNIVYVSVLWNLFRLPDAIFVIIRVCECEWLWCELCDYLFIYLGKYSRCSKNSLLIAVRSDPGN